MNPDEQRSGRLREWVERQLDAASDANSDQFKSAFRRRLAEENFFSFAGSLRSLRDRRLSKRRDAEPSAAIHFGGK
jgi:hypothetical protein